MIKANITVSDNDHFNDFIVVKNCNTCHFLYRNMYYNNVKHLPLFLYMKYCEIVYLKRIDKNLNGVFHFAL